MGSMSTTTYFRFTQKYRDGELPQAL
uniref:Uncharacterized protein n=1 Tax=Rhizophora mucronata TaxID=61149 RepID=A0A2P2NCB3_RHIMU